MKRTAPRKLLLAGRFFAKNTARLLPGGVFYLCIWFSSSRKPATISSEVPAT